MKKQLERERDYESGWEREEKRWKRDATNGVNMESDDEQEK